MRVKARSSMVILSAALLSGCAVQPAAPALAPAPILAPGMNSERSDVKPAIAPDGRTAVWGVVEAGGKLVLNWSRRTGDTWSAVAPVPFASDHDFDPAFSPDGRMLYFFSDRPGGLGKDDLWRVAFDPATGTFTALENLGAGVNSTGREWAPGFSADGKRMLFASDGRGGAGKVDLFIAKRQGSGWGAPQPVHEANTADDDFDATFLPDGSIVYSHGNSDDGPVQLFYAAAKGKGFAAPMKLGSQVNCADFVIGPAIASAAPGWLYFSAPCPTGTNRRLDILSVPLAQAIGSQAQGVK